MLLLDLPLELFRLILENVALASLDRIMQVRLVCSKLSEHHRF